MALLGLQARHTYEITTEIEAPEIPKEVIKTGVKKRERQIANNVFKANR
tara:strand:- start:32 stop:178 length:147 start_codon:yes stop_codon:yes gene_type:complete